MIMVKGFGLGGYGAIVMGALRCLFLLWGCVLLYVKLLAFLLLFL